MKKYQKIIKDNIDLITETEDSVMRVIDYPDDYKVTRLDYCQYLMISQTNYTLTYYAEHHPKNISLDSINRYLRQDKLTSKLVWEKVKDDIITDPVSYLTTNLAMEKPSIIMLKTC